MIIGLMLGSFIGIILVSWKIINRYLSDELNKAIEKASKTKERHCWLPRKNRLNK
ncbi:MAG: hypothetical protein IPH68_16880 [Chitinophagaceae bacterium]|nr:hypothetical protein [Chitinophagaceae bacterium]